MKQRTILLHGMSRRPEYKRWIQLKQRCTNKNNKRYKDYGGRGITVAEEWINNFPAFLDHIGPRPSDKHWVDRINNSRGYVPGNVRWALRKEQMRNTRRTRLATIDGRTQCISAWCEERNISLNLVHGRIRKGWSAERAIVETRIEQKNQSHMRPLALRLVAEGKTLAEAASAAGVSPETVSKWRLRTGKPNLPNVGRRNAARDSRGRFGAGAAQSVPNYILTSPIKEKQ